MDNNIFTCPIMSENSKEKTSISVKISRIQRYLLYILLFTLPICIIPLPWDWNEIPMSLVIVSFTTIILALELVKLIKSGKFSIVKTSLDLPVILLLLSYILSTIFSKDINSSIWGVDHRLGDGLIMFLTVLSLALISRSFLSDLRHVKLLLFSFTVGLMVSNVLSILSFLGVNVWSILPVYKNMFQAGLPVLRTGKVYILTNTVSLFISFGFIGEYLISKGKKSVFLVSLITAIISIVGIGMFSIVQGTGLIIYLLLLFVLVNVFVFKKFKLSTTSFRNILLVFLFITLGIAIPFSLLHIPSFRESWVPEDFKFVGQVFLGVDLSWVIASSVFVQSVITAFLGYGVDTFSIAYNIFKPATTTLLPYSSVSFYNAGSEVFTKFTNGGLFWLFCWVFLGYSILKSTLNDFKKLRLSTDKLNLWYLLIIDSITILIFGSSLFTSFSVINILVLMLMISVRGILREALSDGKEDKFVFKLWAGNVSSSSEEKTKFGKANILFSVLILFTTLFVLKTWVWKLVSNMYMLRAEAYYSTEKEKLDDPKVSYDDKKVITDRMVSYYSNAVKYDSRNPLANRKLALMYMDKVNVGVREYLSVEENQRDQQLANEINRLKNFAIDLSKKSTDISENIYANWEARANVYMGLVGVGYNDFIYDSVNSLERSIALNPSNYELYFSEAQMNILNKDKEKALTSLTKVLGINPQYIPALLLSADLNKEEGRLDVYESYLQAAKKILETNGVVDAEIYTEITNKLKDLENKPKEEKVKGEETKKEETNEEETKKNEIEEGDSKETLTPTEKN
ncbi:MAG: tetratricopeptide repeat protein [Candidatus Dojkabacteria bacterium]